jgi:DNA replication and repair protein RecF
VVARVAARNFRNYSKAEVDLGGSTTIVHGPTGAGKTNLLEAIHFGLTGKSCRSANDRDLIRFGERSAHAVVTSAAGDGSTHTFESHLETGQAKLLKVDGVPATPQSPGDAHRPHVCVFMPDRLELVKGPAKARRRHAGSASTLLSPCCGPPGVRRASPTSARSRSATRCSAGCEPALPAETRRAVGITSSHGTG